MIMEEMAIWAGNIGDFIMVCYMLDMLLQTISDKTHGGLQEAITSTKRLFFGGRS